MSQEEVEALSSNGNATVSEDRLYNCVLLTLRKQSGKSPQIGVPKKLLAI